MENRVQNILFGFRFQGTGRLIVVSLRWTLMLLLVVPFSSRAQFEAQMSQYMFNIASCNPAAVGENGMINVSGLHRIQWVGMPGAPLTTRFSINTPLNSDEKLVHGMGINFLNDRIGAFSNQSAQLQYAYKRKLGKGFASLGLDLGFVSVGFIADSVRNSNINSEFHDFLGDTAIPTVDDTGMNLDLSAGLLYSTPNYFAGVSYLHFNTPTIHLNDDRTVFNVRSALYLVGGYDFHLKNPKWKIRSSMLGKSDFVSWQAEISSRVEYDSRFWGGLSYRYQDAAVVFAGIDIINGMRVGYAYDIPVGQMIRGSYGSHEIFISYSFLFDRTNKNRYKSIRIL